MFTKRHFCALAEALSHSRAKANAAHSTIVRELADLCAAHNPRFDRNKFLSACGLPEEGPYPSCRTPAVCKKYGYCPHNIACNN